MASDAVADCCVVGVYDSSRATELPRAYVMLQKGYTASDALAKEIADHVARQVISYKKLAAGVRFVDAIPKSAAGKILRRVVKDWIKKEQEQDQTKARL